MLKRIPRRNHITPVLRELHWLKQIMLFVFVSTAIPHAILKTTNDSTPGVWTEHFLLHLGFSINSM